MNPTRELFSLPGQLDLTLNRLVEELLERHPALANTCLLGIQPRGVFLGRRMAKVLRQRLPAETVKYGELDVTFHRDDFRRKATPLVPNSTHVDFIIEGQNVVLVDDVLFTGRTIRAALDAMLAFGRPASVELMVLVDRRRLRHLPIQASYRGIAIDTLDSENVIVKFSETDERDSVTLVAG
jgi:pyrimidine operon attenuation protein/uracil phosphoribosyltransferase